MLRLCGLVVVGVVIGACTGFFTDALKSHLTNLPIPRVYVWVLAAFVTFFFLSFNWAFLDKDRPLKVNWWYWRFFYLKDVVAELKRQLVLQDSNHSLLPEIVEVSESGVRAPLSSKLLPRLRSRHKEGNHFLVIGEPGAGKTILTFQLVYKLASEARWWRLWRPMPVLLTMSGYRDGTLDSFAKQQIELATSGDGGKVLSDGFDRLMKRRRFVFVFDALDELPEAQMKRFPSDLGNWAKPGRGDPTFLATARTREIHPDQLQLKSLQVFNLVELSDDATRAVIAVYAAPALCKEIYNDLEKHGVLDRGGLGRNPFWLQAILRAQLYDKGRALILDSSVSNLLLREWNKPDAKRGWAKVEERDDQLGHTKLALGWLAYQMLAANQAAISQDEARFLVEEETSKRLGIAKLAATDVLGLGRDALLLSYVGRDIRFRHQILQSFFATLVLIEEVGLLEKLLASGSSVPFRWWNSLLLLNEMSERQKARHDKLLKLAFDGGLDPARCILTASLLDALDQYLYPEAERVKTAVIHQLLDGDETAVLDSLRVVAAISPTALTGVLSLVIDRGWGRVQSNEEQEAVYDACLSKAETLLRKIIEGEIEASTAARTLSALFRDYTTAPLAGRAVAKIGQASSEALLRVFANTMSPELLKALGEARIESAVPALASVARGELRLPSDRKKQWTDLMADPSKLTAMPLETGAIEALGKIGSPASIPLLRDLARSDDIIKAMSAFDALAETGIEAVPALLAVAESNSILGNQIPERVAIMGKASIPHLLQGLNDSHERVRSASVHALQRIGDGSVASAVAEHVTDLVFPSEVPNALAVFGSAGASAIIHVVLTRADLPQLNKIYLCEAFTTIGSAGILPLAAALANSNPDQREFFIQALGKTKAPEAAQHLLPLLTHPDESTRRATLRAFGDLQDKAYIKVIHETIKDHASLLMYADGCVSIAQLGVEAASQWVLSSLEAGFPELTAEQSSAMQLYLAARSVEINLTAAIPVLEKLISRNGKDAATFESMLKGLQVKAERSTPAASNP